VMGKRKGGARRANGGVQSVCGSRLVRRGGYVGRRVGGGGLGSGGEGGGVKEKGRGFGGACDKELSRGGGWDRSSNDDEGMKESRGLA